MYRNAQMIFKKVTNYLVEIIKSTDFSKYTNYIENLMRQYLKKINLKVKRS
jgi:hypothetical protein